MSEERNEPLSIDDMVLALDDGPVARIVKETMIEKMAEELDRDIMQAVTECYA
jgi:hypothetical protein